jgi:hypothetical protein
VFSLEFPRELRWRRAVIYVGIDDTDMPDTPGTNQLAKALVALLADEYRCRFILRHQLFFDPRVPYTSKNGSASIHLEPNTQGEVDLASLIGRIKKRMFQWYVEGSDPGLCVTAADVPHEVIAWGRRCRGELVRREEAEELARRTGVHLEGLGGTRGGMIGALAAVGLAAAAEDGRVVVHGTWPDDLEGVVPAAAITSRGIEIRDVRTGDPVSPQAVDVGKHLRPNIRDRRVVVFVESVDEPSTHFRAVRLN